MLKFYFLFFIVFFALKADAYDLITSKKVTQERVFSKKIVGLNNAKMGSKKNVVSSSRYSCFGKNEYDLFIKSLGKLHGVDPQFIRAIIASESCFNPKAVSHKGAQGLMQLMPFTAKRFGVVDSFNAEQNISGGVKYLKFLQKRFKGNLELVAASYNAGEGAVEHYHGIPPYNETINYVKRVMSLYLAKQRNKKGGSIIRKIVPLKTPERCPSNIEIKPHSYLEVNELYVRRFYNGSNADTYSQISLKTALSSSLIKSLNDNSAGSKQERRSNNQKVLLWQCEL